jgi:zinc protease
VVGTGVRSNVTAPSVSEIFKELRGMTEKPLTGEELQVAKDSLARSLPANFESSDNAASTSADVYIYEIGLDYFSKYADLVDAVTADQATAASQI